MLWYLRYCHLLDTLWERSISSWLMATQLRTKTCRNSNTNTLQKGQVDYIQTLFDCICWSESRYVCLHKNNQAPWPFVFITISHGARWFFLFVVPCVHTKIGGGGACFIKVNYFCIRTTSIITYVGILYSNWDCDVSRSNLSTVIIRMY